MSRSHSYKESSGLVHAEEHSNISFRGGSLSRRQESIEDPDNYLLHWQRKFPKLTFSFFSFIYLIHILSGQNAGGDLVQDDMFNTGKAVMAEDNTRRSVLSKFSNLNMNDPNDAAGTTNSFQFNDDSLLLSTRVGSPKRGDEFTVAVVDSIPDYETSFVSESRLLPSDETWRDPRG